MYNNCNHSKLLNLLEKVKILRDEVLLLVIANSLSDNKIELAKKRCSQSNNIVDRSYKLIAFFLLKLNIPSLLRIQTYTRLLLKHVSESRMK